VNTNTTVMKIISVVKAKVGLEPLTCGREVNKTDTEYKT